MSNEIKIPKNVLKRKIRENIRYIDLYNTLGDLKKSIEGIPDNVKIEWDYGYYESDSGSYYVTLESEESDEDYNDRIENYVKRKQKQANYNMVANHIIDYVKANSPSLDDVLKSLSVFKGKKFGFRCSNIVDKLLADGYIYFNEDKTKVLFRLDYISKKISD